MQGNNCHFLVDYFFQRFKKELHSGSKVNIKKTR